MANEPNARFWTNPGVSREMEKTGEAKPRKPAGAKSHARRATGRVWCGWLTPEEPRDWIGR